jgi:hypothetical protein
VREREQVYGTGGGSAFAIIMIALARSRQTLT